MEDRLTERELELLEQVKHRFGQQNVIGVIGVAERPRGAITSLHISIGNDAGVDIDRARIAWPGESPSDLAEAVAQQFELLGFNPSRQAPQAPVSLRSSERRSLFGLWRALCTLRATRSAARS